MIGPFLQGLIQTGQTLGQLTKWLYVAKETGLATHKAYHRFYDGLSLENQEKVDAIIRWGVKQVLMKGMLPDVLGAVGDQVVQLSNNQAVAEIAKEAVKRASEIGIDAALNEAHGK